ncbi:MAG: hypothetical protein KKF00_03200 [Proteobacteria bacterium]|nr:hypothetical protein [Pseudomonadota bacterium]
MPQSYGTIKEGDQALLENILIWFEITQDQRSGLKDWYGSFELPSGRHIEPGGPYRLTLSDGRSGDILISNIQIGGTGSSVQFQGSGPLK